MPRAGTDQRMRSQLGFEPAADAVTAGPLAGWQTFPGEGSLLLSGPTGAMTVVLVPNHSIPPAEGTHELAHLVLPSLATLDPAVHEAAVGGDTIRSYRSTFPARRSRASLFWSSPFFFTLPFARTT